MSAPKPRPSAWHIASGAVAVEVPSFAVQGRSRAAAHLIVRPKNAIEDPPVIHPRHAARLVGEHRLDDTPLMVIEFVPHDSRLHFGTLNHGRREPSTWDQYVRNYSTTGLYTDITKRRE
jgi:hypothetical protein